MQKLNCPQKCINSTQLLSLSSANVQCRKRWELAQSKVKDVALVLLFSLAKIDYWIDEGCQVIESVTSLWPSSWLFCFVFILRALSCYVIWRKKIWKTKSDNEVNVYWTEKVPRMYVYFRWLKQKQGKRYLLLEGLTSGKRKFWLNINIKGGVQQFSSWVMGIRLEERNLNN